jgi:hypothetical protein
MCSYGSVAPRLAIVALISFLAWMFVSHRPHVKQFEKKYFEEFVKRPPK